MNKLFYSYITDNPIIAAVNDLNNLGAALASPAKIIFLLKADIFNLQEIVNKVKSQDKLVFVHLDLIEGFSKDQVAVKFINEYIKPDGIISTKSNLCKKAKELNMFTIQRIFALDSLSIDSGLKTVASTNPDAVEILPGTIAKIIKVLKGRTHIPLIASGLIKDKEDIIGSLKAGAVGISASCRDIWYM